MSEHILLGGTDGFRGAVDLENPAMGTQNEVTHYWLTAATISLQKELGHDGQVVVARDTRPSGYRLAHASIQAARDADVEVLYLDIAPTPVAQKVAQLTGAMATIAVTASHNPVSDNGWKGMLGSYKPDAKQVQDISNRAWSMYEAQTLHMPDFSGVRPDSGGRGYAYKPRYQHELLNTIQRDLGERPLEGKIIVYDGANGAGSVMAPEVLETLGAEVRRINCGEGVINNNCGAAQKGLTSLKSAIEKMQLADNPNFLGGIANDGDADRLMAVGAVTKGGTTELVEINGNHALYQLAQGEPGIVGTIYTNSGLRTKLQAQGVEFAECGNGDQYVTKELQGRQVDGWHRGGEFTGHLIDMQWLNSGDGVAMAAWLSSVVAQRLGNFGELYRQVPLWQESMQEIQLSKGLIIEKDDPRLQHAQAWAVQQMAGEGRSIVRPSGTEPVVRAWIESPHGLFAERVGTMLRSKLYGELLGEKQAGN